jgi:hypothetical protein
MAKSGLLKSISQNKKATKFNSHEVAGEGNPL